MNERHDDDGAGRATHPGPTIRGVRADRALHALEPTSTSPWIDPDLDSAELDDDLDDDLPADSELVMHLRSLLDPSEDLTARTQVDVDRTLRGRSVLATGFELLGLGVATARELLSDPPLPADREPEGI